MYYNSFYTPIRVNRPQNMPQKFPEDIECVMKSKDPAKGSIFVSNIEAAENPQTLKKHQIKAVLSCAKGYRVSHPQNIVHHYKYITAEDKESYDLTPHFEECVEFIKNALDKTNILVHCIAGVSRSVSMVIAYLIKQHGMGYDQAYYLVKSRRKIIHPNEGFVSQLRKFHKKVKGQPQDEKTAVAGDIHHQNPENKTTRRDEYMQQYDQNAITRSKTSDFDRNPQVYNKSVDLSSPKRGHAYTPTRHKYAMDYPYGRDPITRQLKWPQQTTSSRVLDMGERKSIQKFDNFAANFSTPIKIKPDQTERKDTNFKQISFKADSNTTRKGYFDAMNSELNSKIQAIRQKYQKQRQQLLNNTHRPNIQKQTLNYATDNSRKRGMSAKFISHEGSSDKKGDIHARYQQFLKDKFESNGDSYDHRYLSNRKYNYSYIGRAPYY